MKRVNATKLQRVSPKKNENQQERDNFEAPKPQANINEVDLNLLERDPAKRITMWNYPLEYSPTTHSAYCFLCYIFNDTPNVGNGHDAFTVKGFDNWKKVNDGKKCAFLKHIDCSQHRRAVEFSENLLNQATHIDNIIDKQSEEELLKNRIRLKALVDTGRWLTFQACGFQGHDETFNSKNQEILGIIANNVRKHIRSEVGDSYFCVMVDESRDESKKEQMAIVLRFVDAEGIIRERFLDLVHVTDTFSLTLKSNLWRQLLRYEFDDSKICGQGYDGASNMRGELNVLQALVIKDCPYAYYVHCFAHKLQLALVALKEIIPINQFFNNLVSIINVVCSSSKRHDEFTKGKGGGD
ncbi:uncharacterized protein LOC143574465 [Bidens hawaiensis]|uniref:uncharacterized protein LOC143574465 n=1 Tax=Bidens hawaiensis TaxID=980011 RepID=UPI00404AE34C